MDLETFLSKMCLHVRCDVLSVQVSLFFPIEILVFRFKDLYVSVESRDLRSTYHLMFKCRPFILKCKLVSFFPKEVLNFDFTDVVN